MVQTALLAGLLYIGLIQGALAAGDYMAVYTKAGSFEDVRDDVEMAILDRGMVVNNVSHVGEMLERGVDIATVANIAGHASVDTTRRYDRRPEATKQQAATKLHFPY